MTLGDDQVLQPAAPTVPDREVVLIHRGQASHAPALESEQDVRFRVLDGVPEAFSPSIYRVIVWRDARRFEQLLDQREDGGLVLERGRANGDVGAPAADR